MGYGLHKIPKSKTSTFRLVPSGQLKRRINFLNNNTTVVHDKTKSGIIRWVKILSNYSCFFFLVINEWDRTKNPRPIIQTIDKTMVKPEVVVRNWELEIGHKVVFFL